MFGIIKPPFLVSAFIIPLGCGKFNILFGAKFYNSLLEDIHVMLRGQLFVRIVVVLPLAHLGIKIGCGLHCGSAKTRYSGSHQQELLADILRRRSFSPDCVPLIDLFTLSSALEIFVVSPPISTAMPWILDAICVTTSLQA